MNIEVNCKAIKLLLLCIAFGYPLLTIAQRDSTEIFESGKTVFNTYCNACHGVHQAKLGPMLASITKKRSEDWLLSFINNSQAMILSDDTYASFLFEQYNQVVMPSFRHLPEQKLKDVLFYITQESINPSEDIISYPRANQYSNPTVVKGKALFNNKCATCHFINKDGYGPALGSVTNRRPTPWLIEFIKNSQEVIKGGDDYATFLYKRYDQKIMPSFAFLNQGEIMAILDFVTYASASPPTVSGTNGRNFQQKISALPVSTISKKTLAKNQEKRIPFKIMLIVFASLGALIHGFIVVKLFLYLQRGN